MFGAAKTPLLGANATLFFDDFPPVLPICGAARTAPISRSCRFAIFDDIALPLVLLHVRVALCAQRAQGRTLSWNQTLVFKSANRAGHRGTGHSHAEWGKEGKSSLTSQGRASKSALDTHTSTRWNEHAWFYICVTIGRFGCYCTFVTETQTLACCKLIMSVVGVYVCMCV